MVYVQNPLACTGPSTWTTSPPAATFPYYHNKTSPKQGTPPDTQRDRFREEQTRRPRQQERTRVHDLACTDFTTGITTKSPSLTQVSHTTGTPPLRIPYTQPQTTAPAAHPSTGSSSGRRPTTTRQKGGPNQPRTHPSAQALPTEHPHPWIHPSRTNPKKPQQATSTQHTRTDCAPVHTPKGCGHTQHTPML